MPLFDQGAWGTQPFPNPWMPPAPAAPPAVPPMPMPPYGAAPPPGMPQSPALPAATPQVPDPALAAAPPVVDPTRTANTTGGPTQPQPHRAEVGAQLYRLGKQMPGQNNLFGGFGPPPAAPVDPFALLPGMAPDPSLPPAPPLQAQPSPAMGPMPPSAAQPKPVDRFPRLSRLMGRPVVPEPKPKKR